MGRTYTNLPFDKVPYKRYDFSSLSTAKRGEICWGVRHDNKKRRLLVPETPPGG